MHYLDASLIVALLTPETHSERADGWFSAQAPGSLCISGWAATEVASALALKLRTGALSPDRRAAALAVWKHMRADNLLTLAIEEDHFERAADFVGSHELGLRAGDALHLAIAADAGTTLATLDTKMAEAALQLGIPVAPL